MSDYDINLRITAENGTKEALKAMQQDFKQTAYEANRGIKTLADGTKVNLEQVGRAAMQMGVTRKAMLGHMEMLATAAAKHGKTIKEVNEMTPKATSATNALSQSLRSGVSAFGAATVGMVGLAAVVETARRGFIRFAEVDKNLRLVQNQTGLTKQRIHELGNEMKNLALITGDSKDTMLDAFEELREKGNFTPEEAKKLLPDIAVIAKGMKNTTAAALAGAIGDIKRNLKLAPNEVKYIWEALSHVVEEYNIDVGKLGPNLSRVTEMASQWGFKSVEGMQELLTIIGVVKEATGDEARAAEAVSHLLANIGNEALGLNLGYAPGEFFNKYKDAAEKNLPVVSMLIQDIAKSADPRKTLRDIGIRDELIINKLISDQGRLGNAIDKTAKASGALEKGLNITQSPSAGLEKTVVVMWELLEALGKVVNLLGNSSIWTGFLGVLSDIAEKISTIVDLLDMVINFRLPSWMSWESFSKRSYEKFAPKDKLGRPIVPYDEYQRGADVKAETKKYNERQVVEEAKREERKKKIEEDARAKRDKELDEKYPGTRKQRDDTGVKLKKVSDATDKVGASLVNYAETAHGPEVANIIKASLQQYGGSADAKYLSAGYTPSGRGYFGQAAPGGDQRAGGGTGYGGGTRLAPPYSGGPTGPGQFPGGGMRPSGPPPARGVPRQGVPEGPGAPRPGAPQEPPQGPGAPGATYGPQDRSNKSIPASIRYNNPGAQWPSQESKRFGQTDEGVIGGGNKIAGFPTAVHGLASNIALLKRKYVGKRIGDAIYEWSGHGRSSVPGYDSNAILTDAMANDPKFWEAMAGAESGRKGSLSREQINQALEMERSGSAAAYEKAHPEFVEANKGKAARGAQVASTAPTAPGGGTPEGVGPPSAGPTPGQKPGDIPYHYQGEIEMEGKRYRYGSGGSARGATPPGSYDVNVAEEYGGKGELGDWGRGDDPYIKGNQPRSIATIGGKGGTYKDPRYGEQRSGVQIHAATSARLDKLYSAGCIAVHPDDWPAYKAHLLDLHRRTPGGLRIDIGKDGRAQIVAKGSQLPVPGGPDKGEPKVAGSNIPGGPGAIGATADDWAEDIKAGTPEHTFGDQGGEDIKDAAKTRGGMPLVGGDGKSTAVPMPQVGGDTPSSAVPMPQVGPTEQRDINVRFNVNDREMQFARASMRKQADREVREARWNSYADIGAA